MNKSRVAASFESFRCYHILQFMVELEDGSSIFQPTLLESELMRLLRALDVCRESDLTSQVNRLGLFINAASTCGANVVAYFGRQSTITSELQQRGWYPNNLQNLLMEEDEGIYAIFLDQNKSSEPFIIIFSWLMDEAFLPESIRNRATYALRFLTTLSSNVILCFNDIDWAELKLSNPSTSMEAACLDTYSFEFKIESAAIEEERVSCGFIRQKHCSVAELLPSATGDAVVVGANFTHAERFVCDTVYLRTRTDQSRWFLRTMDTHTIDLRCQIPIDVMMDVLQQSGKLPLEQLEEYTEQAFLTKQKCEARTFVIERLYQHKTRLTKLASNLLYQNNDMGETKADKSFETVLSLLIELFGPRIKAAVNALDFRRQIRKAILEKYEELTLPKNQTITWREWIWSGPSFSKKFEFPFLGHPDTFNELLPFLINDLEATFEQWKLQLAQVIESEQNIELAVQRRIRNQPKYSVVRTSLQQKRDQIVHYTFCKNMAQQNSSKQTGTLRAWVSYNKFHGCLECTSQRIDGGNTKIQVNHFGISGEDHHISYVSVPLDSKIALQYAVGNGIVVVVYIHEKKTHVEALLGHPQNILAPLKTKRFPTEITLCDFDSSRRMLVLLHSDTTIEVYAFNESYKALERKRQLSLGIMRLELPITNLIIFGGDENGLVVTDSKYNIRMYHFRSRQISPMLENIMKPKSLLVKVHDGTFVMFLSLSQDATKIVIQTLVSRDHSMLPTTEVEFPTGWQWDKVQAHVYGDYLVIFETSTKCTQIFQLEIATGKMAWNLRSIQHDDTASEESHLLWSLFHCFEKFPVRSLMENNSACRVLQNPLRLHIALALPETKASLTGLLRAIMVKLRAQNKPLYDLDLVQSLITYTDVSMDSDVWTRVSLNSWILELIGFVPVPICRAVDDNLILLRHGVCADYDGKDASAIAKQIDFGPISQVLQWWAGPVVVITSMGKQSTGKSYFLNHLTGSSFASSGARCTDGVWITVRALDKCLVVVLDFEGLGSFERTAQEDMLLSILNAAISRLTVFRIEMRFDKDIDSMFSKFQQGVSLLKGDPRLFQGKLYLNAKDVNPNDQQSVVAEFFGKLQKILNENRSDNFVSTMYGGHVLITCAPPLGSMGYYDALGEAFKSFEAARNEKTYKNGLDFYDCLTMILAKISLLDWTGLESIVKEKRTLALRIAIGIALRCCQLVEGEDPVCDRSDTTILAQYFQFMQTHEGHDAIPMDNELDFEIDFFQTDPNTLQPLVKQVLLKYAAVYFKISSTKRTQLFEKRFDALLEFIIWRREYRIRKWFGTLTDVNSDARDDLDKSLTKFKQLFRRCQHTCTDCQLGCFESVLHNSPHDCGTNHQCDSFCYYCVDTSSLCGLAAGHTGNCNCKVQPHTCTMPCELKGASNCERVCHLVVGHRGSHLCSVPLHCCGQSCQAVGCRGSCSVRFELPHEVHSCGASRCQQLCTHPGCGNTCMSNDHFHPQHAIHDCNNEHRCQCQCDAQGTCDVKVLLEQTTETFHGKRDTFTYVSKEMNGTRKQCAINLDVGCFDHNGNQHACDATIHYCTERCPCCEYFCEKEFGHRGLHSTSHGNMKNAHFVSDTNAFDIGDKKYEAGETGVAEMCPYFCLQMGRGHVHYVPCSHANAESCVDGCEGRRHCTEKLLPAPDTQMDEVLHDAYWKAIGWEDPVIDQRKREEFGLCPYKCCAVEHENEEEVSYCTLKAWHSPQASVPEGSSPDHSIVHGHQFACRHQTSSGLKHHVFVLDASSSMGGSPWQNLLQAVRTYVNDQVEKNGGNDIVSIITFGTYGNIIFESKSMEFAKSASIPFKGGCTYFQEGLHLAHEVLSRNDHNTYTPVMLFFSDGDPHDFNDAMTAAGGISDEFDCFGLQSFCIGFGNIDHQCLEKVAAQLGGTCLKAVGAIELVQTFKQISVSVLAKTGLFATSVDHEKIENIIKSSVYVAQPFVYGDSLHAVLVGIIVPEEEEIKNLAKTLNISGTFPELCKDPKIIDTVLKDIVAVGKKGLLNGFECVCAILLHPEPFTVENDLLTPTFKIKRNDVKKLFIKEIDALYAKTGDVVAG